ncbi:hypothetical protein ILUMI_17748 [Ignelater luminosus]|uniref:Uncharacterized protein n=1 Tax=Ignelater luminosus TaxID=2038154 RepID=A0A8K0CL62_IGNLU|nr:hypothetical protein ILUMI_17748 [Ignelater luminosus]
MIMEETNQANESTETGTNVLAEHGTRTSTSGNGLAEHKDVDGDEPFKGFADSGLSLGADNNELSPGSDNNELSLGSDEPFFGFDNNNRLLFPKLDDTKSFLGFDENGTPVYMNSTKRARNHDSILKTLKHVGQNIEKTIENIKSVNVGAQNVCSQCKVATSCVDLHHIYM